MNIDEDADNDNFRVAIRVRPPVPRELDGPRAFINVVRIPNDHKSITLCEHLDVDDARGGVYSTQAFTFDHVYDPTDKQHHVYERSAQPAVQSVLKGYNATLIAYGQTGTGKTYTMEGFTNNENRGIIPRATEEIFSYIHSLRNNRNVKFLVRASYLQIYNEVISDLLKPLNKQLSVRHTRQRGVYIEGLSEWVVRSPDDVYGLMERGCSLRATGSTKMSELSSRSHAMFIIIVEVMEGDESNPQSYKYGKLNIVDLAGSEKVRQTGVTGQRLEETKKINWSLHELGNVISALTDKRTRDKHIPFRNSQLTRVLQDSLGGNCKTTLIACISPALEAYSESLSTLKFANRAKNIKNEATINEDVDQGALLRRYEKELQRLRQALQEKGGGGYVDPTLFDALQSGKRQVEEDHRAALQALEDTSRAMEVEQVNKKRLEERINELETMLGDGAGGPRAADEYAMRLDELDRERQVMEEDKAQVDRYKQLLLKQRDVMLNLTTRLNERDETILHLQEEIDAYDAHIQMLEDSMEANATSLGTRSDAEAYLGRIRCRTDMGGRYRSEGNPDHLLTADEKIIELLMLKGRGGEGAGGGGGGKMADDERRSLEVVMRDRLDAIAAKAAGANVRRLQNELEQMRQKVEVAESRRRAAEAALSQPSEDNMRRVIEQEQAAVRNQFAPKLTQALGDLGRERDRTAQLRREVDAISVELTQLKSLLDGPRRQDVDRLRSAVLSIEDSLQKGVAFDGSGSPPSSSLSSPSSNAASFHGDPNASRVPQLESMIASLRKANAEVTQRLAEREAQTRGAVEAALAAKEKEYSQMTRSLSTHIKDRKALKTILESRIRVKVESICDQIAQQVDRQKILSDARALQNLVNASVAAMDSSDV